jgi:glycosyltransferase involved in cell wall biosynthesis
MPVRPAYLDIAPLFEEHWTGIPVVTAQLAKRAIADRRRPWFFLNNNQLVPLSVVCEVMRSRGARWVRDGLITEARRWPFPTYEEMRSSVAIFPNVKSLRREFWREAMIVHDLSAILTPQYHHDDTIAHHANRLRGDLDSTDMFFCVSRATAEDLIFYFGIDERRILVTPLGVEWLLSTRLSAQALLHGKKVKPFVLVLGTVEPRKNIRIVVDYLSTHPQILAKYTFVFAGRDGWLEERQKLERIMQQFKIPPECVIFSGFISDAMKLALLQRAAFCIFPSMFEGFGLPVLEALSVSCPVLCSSSSSLTEVADATCILFDPSDSASFAAGFSRMEKARERRPSLTTGVCVGGDEHSWDRMYKPVETWLKSLDQDHCDVR